MYNTCTIFVRLPIVQVLYNYCTYIVQMTERVGCRWQGGRFLKKCQREKKVDFLTMPFRWARAPLCGNSSWNKGKWQLFETHHLEVLQNPSDDARAMRLGFFDSATHPALRAPLSERGWRGSATFNDHLPIIDNQRLSMVRCRAIPSRRGVAEGRGVSHQPFQ